MVAKQESITKLKLKAFTTSPDIYIYHNVSDEPNPTPKVR
jgi:hypothetical protein